MSLQQRIVNYWQVADERYDNYIRKEMHSFKREAWCRLIDENRPAGQRLEVLDIGTGPGFFPLLLSWMGHRVTGVDCTESMLQRARANIQSAGFDVALQLMDSHKLTFDDNSFDLILCRNLTWLLYDPPLAYRCWHRVLKPGGRLLIFDGNWYLWLFDEHLRTEYEQDRQKAIELGYKDTETDREEGDSIGRSLFMSSRCRPQWDVPTLLDIGFKKILVDADITAIAYDEIEKVLYRSIPMFMIRAEKATGQKK